MPSGLGAIRAAFSALVTSITLFKYVETSPASPEDWVKSFRDVDGNKTPAAHVSYDKSPNTQTQWTDGEWNENANILVTFIYANALYDADYVITLKDAILDCVCSAANIDLGGLAEDVNPGPWQIVSQHGPFTVAKISFTVAHHWARS